MNLQQLKKFNAWALAAFQQMEDDTLRNKSLPNDLKTFMQALKPHQTKGHGLNPANTYWLKHVFQDYFGHYMTEEDFVEAIIALSEGWIVKKNTRSTSMHNSMQKPWVLNVNQKAF